LAAEQSKPGSLLYPIKQVVKNAKLALTSNQTAKALLHLEKGEDKIEELKQAAEDENNMNANRIVGDYEHDVNNALKETQNLNQKNIETAKTIDQTLEKHTQTLEQVKDQVPSPAQAAINKAITVSEKGQQQAQEVIQNNPSGNTLPTAIPVTNTPQSGQNHVDNPGSSNSQEQNIPSIQLPTQPQNNQNNNSDFGRNKANATIYSSFSSNGHEYINKFYSRRQTSNTATSQSARCFSTR